MKMYSKNTVLIIGNVGSEPRFSICGNGKPVANVSVATRDEWTDENGTKKVSTDWHRISFYGELAEQVKAEVKTGMRIRIEGSLKNRKHVAENGSSRYVQDIVGKSFKQEEKEEACPHKCKTNSKQNLPIYAPRKLAMQGSLTEGQFASVTDSMICVGESARCLDNVLGVLQNCKIDVDSELFSLLQKGLNQIHDQLSQTVLNHLNAVEKVG